jgi:hypothetical protein
LPGNPTGVDGTRGRPAPSHSDEYEDSGGHCDYGHYRNHDYHDGNYNQQLAAGSSRSNVKEKRSHRIHSSNM